MTLEDANVKKCRVGKADVFYPRAHQKELILFGGHAKKRFAHPTFFNIRISKYEWYIHFQRQKNYIRHILTHKEYDKDTWK